MSISLALIAAAAASAPFADLDVIDRQVEQFTGAAVGQTGGAMQPVDRRLRLKSCAAPTDISWRDSRRETALVQCTEPGGWRLFVPVKSPQPAAQARPAIKRGDAVTIAVSGDGFTVSQPGEAMETGAPGDWIRVRTVAPSQQSRPGQAGEPMRARIIRPGLVGFPLH